MPFQPGVSGNPSGRPKENNEIKKLAREKSPEAFERIVALCHSQDERVSLAACQEVINRGYGKPAQPQTGEDGEGAIILSVKRYVFDDAD